MYTPPASDDGLRTVNLCYSVCVVGYSALILLSGIELLHSIEIHRCMGGTSLG